MKRKISFKKIVEKARKHPAYWLEMLMYNVGETVANCSEDWICQKADITHEEYNKILKGDGSISVEVLNRVVVTLGYFMEFKSQKAVL